jgi:hypothetical protein
MNNQQQVSILLAAAIDAANTRAENLPTNDPERWMALGRAEGLTEALNLIKRYDLQ